MGVSQSSYTSSLYASGYYLTEDRKTWNQSVAKFNDDAQEFEKPVGVGSGGLNSSKFSDEKSIITVQIVYNDTLYVGGYYPLNNGKIAPTFGTVDENNKFKQISVTVPTGGEDGYIIPSKIFSMAVYKDELYVAGCGYGDSPSDSTIQFFAKIIYDENGDIKVRHIIKDLTKGEIYTMTVFGTSLYIGGYSNVSVHKELYVARYNKHSESFEQILINDSQNLPMTGEINVMDSFWPGDLYIGGAKGIDSDKLYVARYTTTLGDNTFENILPDTLDDTEGHIYCMQQHYGYGEPDIYIGGEMNKTQYVTRYTRFGDNNTFENIFDGSTSGKFRAMTVYKEHLYIAGERLTNQYVAKYNGRSFENKSKGLAGNSEGPSSDNSEIYALIDPSKEDDNLALILGLVLGLGLPLLLLLFYYMKRRRG